MYQLAGDDEEDRPGPRRKRRKHEKKRRMRKRVAPVEAGIKTAPAPVVVAPQPAVPQPETPVEKKPPVTPQSIVRKPKAPPGLVKKAEGFHPMSFVTDIDPVTGLPFELIEYAESDETKPVTAQHVAAEKTAKPQAAQVEKAIRQERQQKVVGRGVGLLTLLTLLRGF